MARAHTSDLPRSGLVEIRSLLDAAFDGDFPDEDWEHILGGVHVLVYDDAELVAHAAVVRRTLVHRERFLRTGYVEGVAVRADRRGRGLAGGAMSEVEAVIREEYELGALSDGTGIPGFYERRGWIRWQGPTFVLTPRGPVATPEEGGSVLVLTTPASPELDLRGPIACDWRSGDVW